MPIRKRQGEKKNDFISRCIGEEVQAGKAVDGAAAICYTYWEDFNLKDIKKRRSENLKLSEERLKEISTIKYYGAEVGEGKSWGMADAEREDEILLELREAIPDGYEPVYRYEAAPDSGYGSSGVGFASREFCKRMMRDGKKFYSLSEITKLNKAEGKVDRVLNKVSRADARRSGDPVPAAKRVGYSVFNWRGGVNCKHVWVRYFLNPKTGDFLDSPSQPANLPVGLA